VIAPYVPKGAHKEPDHAIYAEEKDILDGKSLQKYGKDFIAVLLNPPYAGEFSSQVGNMNSILFLFCKCVS
jgi:hypothetical protein